MSAISSSSYSGHVLVLFGPTASGKTSIAVDLAQRLPVEVVSADSRQIRKRMSIGTAAPSETERTLVPHHLVSVVEPDAPWTVTDWLSGAHAALSDIWSRGRLPLLVAGTGYYAWSLLEGRSIPKVAPNLELRSELERLAEDQGSEALHELLAERDPRSARRIESRNVRRVVRALEIIDATNAPVPSLRRDPPNFTWTAVGLQWPRSLLYERADRRATEMYDAGLLEETRSLVMRYGDRFEALRSIGYAEALQVIEGNWSSDQALLRTQSETHRLIRMQGTWFRKDDSRIHWLDARIHDNVLTAIEEKALSHVR